MGRKDASATQLPVDQYRKQIGKQDYKKTQSVLKATRLKAEAKKNTSGFRLLEGCLKMCLSQMFGQKVFACCSFIRCHTGHSMTTTITSK
uniref:Triple QxxK/R motif-containing protein n=1 Tax=Oryzias sinensis TaxID=183150 RepID=A0A8C8DJ09_9TELE